MTDKTVIEEIQARADLVDAELAHADRNTLLSILAEAGELPEGCQVGFIKRPNNDFSRGFTAGGEFVIDELQAILKRTGLDSGNS